MKHIDQLFDENNKNKFSFLLLAKDLVDHATITYLNKELQEKMQDPTFKEKMMKNKNNPMALLGDPEVMNLVGKLASNMNMPR